MNRFLSRAGCIPWSRKSSKDLIKWLEENMPALCITSKSTGGFRDLHRKGILEMESLNSGMRAPSYGKALSHDMPSKRRERVLESLRAPDAAFENGCDAGFADEIEDEVED